MLSYDRRGEKPMSPLEMVLIAGAVGALAGAAATVVVNRLRGGGSGRKLRKELALSRKRVEDTRRIVAFGQAEDRRGHAETAKKLNDLARMLRVDPEALPYPQRLTAHRFGITSQEGEDGVVWGLLKAAGGDGRRFVELGCGDNGGNSGFLATELGWSGLMVDGDEDLTTALRREIRGDRTTVVTRWIERDTVNDLVSEFGFDGEIEMLGIDVDGVDFWIFEALTVCSPRLLVMEYNTAMGPERSVTVPYSPDFSIDRDETWYYYGASLTALTRLASRKGYRLVACEHVNAFFLRNDVAPEIPGCSVSDAYKVYAKEADRIDRMRGGVFRVLDKMGLVLQEVDEDGHPVPLSPPAAP
jgi:hypothetical protein